MKSLKLAEGWGGGGFYAKDNALCVTFLYTKQCTVRNVFIYKKPESLRYIYIRKKYCTLCYGFICKMYSIVLIPNLKCTYNQSDQIEKY